MKAIGKGSLASLLAAGLHIVRAIMFVAFFGLCVAAAVMPFVPALIALSHHVHGVNIETDNGVSVGDYVKVLNAFVAVGVSLYIINRLLEILRTLRFGSPFVKENAERFKKVGYALLLGEAGKIIFKFLGLIFDAKIKYHTELTIWIAIIAVFVLAEVFREGAKMKEEQDLTV